MNNEYIKGNFTRFMKQADKQFDEKNTVMTLRTNEFYSMMNDFEKLINNCDELKKENEELELINKRNENVIIEYNNFRYRMKEILEDVINQTIDSVLNYKSKRSTPQPAGTSSHQESQPAGTSTDDHFCTNCGRC